VGQKNTLRICYQELRRKISAEMVSVPMRKKQIFDLMIRLNAPDDAVGKMSGREEIIFIILFMESINQ
jgi:hypothetical protein